MRKPSLLLALPAATIAAESADFVIVGAGTAGLVVANRLSADPDVTVAVIEPGNDERNNPNVTDPSLLNMPIGTALDWQYQTTPQPGADDRQFQMAQGKAWGGSSAINGMTYLRGDAAVFDSWEDLRNPGWNWEALLPYFKRSEQYIAPGDDQVLTGASYEPESHGLEGSVRVGYPATLQSNNYSDAALATWEKLSVPHSPDLNSGVGRGFNIGPQTLDPQLNLRWDSARAYYSPVEDRSNLKILKGTVKRITWAKEDNGGGVVADGVEYLTEDGKSHILKAEKEVVVSAGSFRSPLVLEGSGIGNPRILDSLGIDVKVDLPGVGENLQEQPSHIATYQGPPDGIASAYHSFVTAKDLFGDNFPAVEESTRASIPKWAQLAVEASSNSDLNTTAVEHLLTTQHDLLFNKDVPLAELLQAGIEGSEVKGSQTWMLFAFSRGSVHLGSTDDINEPLFDPRLFLADFDFEACTAAAKLARRYWTTEPASDFVTGIVPPQDEELPEDATDAQWEAFIRAGVAPIGHAVGTSSMMSRDLGGVVDPELKVYGTANVRVIDGSVIPTQLSGHMSATVYAVAERAAEILVGTWARE